MDYHNIFSYSFFIALFITLQLTVYASIWLMRAFNGSLKVQGNVGPYVAVIESIEQNDMVKIKVEGYPDAGLVFLIKKKSMKKNKSFF